MKKVFIVLITLTMIFGFVSCDVTNDKGLIEYRVSTHETVSKALEAYDPAKAAVESIVIKFTPVNQSSPVGASSGYEFGLIKWDNSNLTDPTNGTWVDTKHRFLSQGQWKIEAIGTTKTTGTVSESDEETLYYGFVNVYISKVNDSAQIKMTPKSQTSGTGVLMIGYDELGANKKITSKAVVSETASDHRLTYKVYDINGVQKATGTVLGDTFTLGSDGVDSKVSYAQASISTLVQGSYILTMTIDQYDGSSWELTTGGSAVDVGVYKGLSTYVWGTVSPSDYIHTSVSTSMDIDGGINLSVTPSSGNKVFTASVTYEKGSDLTVDKYLWFVDGNITVDTTGTFSPTFDSTSSQNGTGIKYGEHLIQCVAVDTTKKVKSEMKVVTIKYNFGTSSWDVL